MSIIATALQCIRSWVGAEKSAQLGRRAIHKTLSKPGTRERAILHAIRILRDSAHKTNIKNEIQRATKRDLGLGAVAMTIDWLEDRGFIAVRESENAFERGGRKRRYYTLTAKGEEALRG